MPISAKRNTVNTTRHVLVVKLRSFNLYIFAYIFVLFGCEEDTPRDVPVVHDVPIEAQAPELLDSTSIIAIEDYFTKLFDEGKFNGVALFHRDSKQYAFAKGLKSFEGTGDSLTIQDQFQLASLSKPFTAYAVLQLIERGLINMEDSLTEFLPCTPYNNVTIRHLLTHTSGIGYYAYVTDSLWDSPENMMSNADLLTMMECKEIPNYFAPSRYFDYCNTNYALLANVIANVSGMPFHDYMNTHVFEPLGMEHSEIMQSETRDATMYDVQGHFPNRESKLPSYLDGIVGDKGMYSTLDDLLRFYQAKGTSQFVNDSIWNEATMPQEKYGRNLYYGYGWRIKPIQNGDTLVYHNGWWRGFRTYFWMSKKTDKVCIVLTNWVRGGYLNQKEVWLLF